MILRVVWRRRSASCAAPSPEARLRALLLAARKTLYYRPLLEAAGIGTPEEIRALSPLEALRRLPHVDLSAWRGRPSDFVNHGTPRPEPARLFNPLPPLERCAVVAAGFRSSRGVRVFEEPRRSKLIRYRPQLLAGPVSVLRGLAEAVEDRGAPVPRVSHGVVAFSGVRHGFLSEEARDLFWRIFEAPVFGQYLGLDGELLAWECEAHDGLHIRGGEAIFETDDGDGEPELLVTSLENLRHPVLRLATGLTARIEHCACACGETTTRLAGLRRRMLTRARASLAACAAD